MPAMGVRNAIWPRSGSCGEGGAGLGGIDHLADAPLGGGDFCVSTEVGLSEHLIASAVFSVQPLRRVPHLHPHLPPRASGCASSPQVSPPG